MAWSTGLLGYRFGMLPTVFKDRVGSMYDLEYRGYCTEIQLLDFDNRVQKQCGM